MSRCTLAIILALLALLIAAIRAGATVPPRATQPHVDIFPCGSVGCDSSNPVTVAARVTRTASYRLITAAGCSTGTIPSDLEALAQDAAKNYRFNLVRNDAAYDFTVYINCGNEQIRQCGSVNIFCLPYGFPYHPDVSVSDILNTYPAVTRRSILNHEILGHAIGTWNEQYCVGYETSGACAGLPQFTSAPGNVDVMNTGPDSRHDIGIVEVERWDRTMYPLIVQCISVGYDPCTERWRFDSGWSYSPSLDQWYDATGRLYWEARAPWGGRHSPVLHTWLNPGAPYFADDQGVWNLVP